MSDLPEDWPGRMSHAVRGQLDAGESAQAVLTASRLVTRLGERDGVTTSADLGEAMTLLVLAFEADGDPEGAAQVARALLGRSGVAAPVRVLTAELLGRILAEIVLALLERGELDAAVDQGDQLLAALDTGGWVTTGVVPRARAGPDPGVEPAEVTVRRAFRALGESAWAGGLVARSVCFYRAGADRLTAAPSVADRREHATLVIGAAQGLALLQRWDELKALCDHHVAVGRADDDSAVLESAVVAGCMSAQASLALGRPDEALLLARGLEDSVPDGHPHRAELEVRVGLALGAAELETHGPAAAETVYAGVVERLGHNLDPGMGVFLAIALEMDCAMLCQLDRMADAARVGRELAQLIGACSDEADFATAAECGNRTAERLISYADVEVAAVIAHQVTSRGEARLLGDDEAVRLRGYAIRFDALRRGNQPAAMMSCWAEIVELDAAALLVLDDLAERYRDNPALRAALLDTYIGRMAVLARLGRPSEAAGTLREVLAEFSGDADEQIQLMLAQFRADDAGD